MRCLLTGALLFSALMLPASLSAQQLPAGYYIGEHVVLPDSAYESLSRGAFHIAIERVAGNAAEFQMLALAERLYPDTSVINRSVRAYQAARRQSGVQFQKAALTPGERWWWTADGDVFHPFAVTGAAVEHYRRALYSASARQNSTEARSQPPHRASFEYFAKVDTTSRYPGATHIVRLTIHWSYWCGQMCATTFSHNRHVYFRADGSVLRVDGDGIPSVSAA